MDSCCKKTSTPGSHKAFGNSHVQRSRHSAGLTNTALANCMLTKLISEFKTGKITKTISHVPFIKDPDDDRPCWNWTMRNRILMVMQGTFDARNVSQWNSLNRKVVAKSKAIYIIKPMVVYTCITCSQKERRSVYITYKKSKQAFVCGVCNNSYEFTKINEAPDSEIYQRISGYKCQPEFRVEDTVGEPLPEYKPKVAPPLSEVAIKWNITVKYQTDPTRRTMGSFVPETGNIHLGTEQAEIFFHEISHVADNLILKKRGKKLKGGQDTIQEAVAQLSACVLAEMYGTHTTKAFTFEYLRQYVRCRTDEEVVQLALRVLDRTGAVLDLILSTAQELWATKTIK